MSLALVLCLLAFGLNVADALLTDAILALGGREKNPVMAAIMAQPLTRPFRWAIKLSVVVGFCWLAWPRWWAARDRRWGFCCATRSPRNSRKRRCGGGRWRCRLQTLIPNPSPKGRGEACRSASSAPAITPRRC